MDAAQRFENGQHYCILCPPDTASHKSGRYRALTLREQSMHGEQIQDLKTRKLKRAFKVCEPYHFKTTSSRANEVTPHWDNQRNCTPEKRRASDFKTPDKLSSPHASLFVSPSSSQPSTPKKSKSLHSSPTVDKPAKRSKSAPASTCELLELERQWDVWFPSQSGKSVTEEGDQGGVDWKAKFDCITYHVSRITKVGEV